VAEEDVVAQNHRRGRTGEKIAREDIGLRQPVRRRLHDIGELEPPLPSVAQGALNCAWSSGVVMMAISRMPASMRTLSG
jgi:hypothetical protein